MKMIKCSWRKRLGIGLLAVCMGIGFTACAKEEKKDTASQKVFSLGKDKIYLDEVWIYAKTVMEGYEQKYGNQVWAIETEDSRGNVRTMEDITREDIIEDIRCTRILAGKAESYSVSLSDTEKQEAQGQAAVFYNNLTDAQIEQMGINRETVERVFEDNMLADKVYDQIMIEGNVEVSDEEARMTSIYDMHFACYKEDSAGNIVAFTDADRMQQKTNADEALTLLDNPENPAGYDTIVSKYGLNYGGSRTMSYADLVSEYGESLVTMLYTLENGMHTSVVETEYGYHIIGMVALTDSEATARRKQELLQVKQKDYFTSQYEQWTRETDKGWDYGRDVDQNVYGKILFGDTISK